MKLILLLFVSFGACFAHPAKIQAKNLLEEAIEFAMLLPLKEMEEIAVVHLQNDPGLAALVGYLKGVDFKEWIAEIEEFSEVQDFMQYLEDGGIPVEEVEPLVAEMLDAVQTGVAADSHASLIPFIDEEEALVPIDKVTDWAIDKIQNDPIIQDLITKITGQEARVLALKVLMLDGTKEFVDFLKGLGVDANGIMNAKIAKVNPKSLPDILDQLLALINIDEIIATFNTHLANDPALAAVVKFIQTPDFKALIDTVIAFPETQNFIKYLNVHGVPADDLLPMVEKTIEGLMPGVDADANGSLAPFIAEEEALIPVDKLLAFLVEELTIDPDAQDLFVEISGEKAHGLVDKTLVLDEAKALVSLLDNEDVDVDGILDTVYGFLGWGNPPK